MEFLNPEQGIGNEEILHLIFPIVEHLGSPIRVLSLSGVCVFISRHSVKFCQSMGIFWEMCRHPVQNDTDFMFMHIIHEIAEIFRRSVTGGRRIISGNLVSPGTVKGVLCNSHKFYMGVAHIFHIIGQCVSQFPVIVKARVLFLSARVLFPRTRMHFIDGHGVFLGVKLLPFFHPCSVPPFESLQIHNFRGIARTHFRKITVRVGFV